MRAPLATLIAAATLLFAGSAFADKVAVLKFTGDVNSTASAHDATERAVLWRRQ